MSGPEYHELHLLDGERVVAWVFVAPQELPGASMPIGRLERPGEGATLYGDLFCGNGKDGAYAIAVEVNVGDGPDGRLLLGDERYDLTPGRCFVIRPGHIVEQLPHASADAARRHLMAGG